MSTNFDAFINEVAAKPLTITLYDQEWHLPGELSLKTKLQQERLRHAIYKYRGTPVEEYPEWLTADLEELGENPLRDAHAVLGQENVTAWLDKGMTLKQLQLVQGWASTHHAGQPMTLEEYMESVRAAEAAEAATEGAEGAADEGKAEG